MMWRRSIWTDINLGYLAVAVTVLCLNFGICAGAAEDDHEFEDRDPSREWNNSANRDDPSKDYNNLALKDDPTRDWNKPGGGGYDGGYDGGYHGGYDED